MSQYGETITPSNLLQINPNMLEILEQIRLIIDRSRHDEEGYLTDAKTASKKIVQYLQDNKKLVNVTLPVEVRG